MIDTTDYTGKTLRTKRAMGSMRKGTVVRVLGRESAAGARFNIHRIERADGEPIATSAGWAPTALWMLWKAPTDFEVVS